MEKEDLINIISKIDRKELNEFLVSLLLNNESIMNQFRSNFINKFPKISREEYKEKIWDAISDCSDKYGFINYNDARKYTHSMYFFTNEASNLLKNKDYISSFNIVSIILDTIPEVAIDDSNGSTGMVAEECIEVIEDILKHTLLEEDNINKIILDYILNEIKTKALSNYGIKLHTILKYYIDEKKYLDEILESLDYSIKKYTDGWNAEEYKELKNKIEKLK